MDWRRCIEVTWPIGAKKVDEDDGALALSIAILFMVLWQRWREILQEARWLKPTTGVSEF